MMMMAPSALAGLAPPAAVGLVQSFPRPRQVPRRGCLMQRQKGPGARLRAHVFSKAAAVTPPPRGDKFTGRPAHQRARGALRGAPEGPRTHIVATRAGPYLTSLPAVESIGMVVRSAMHGAGTLLLVGLRNIFTSLDHIINDPWTAEEVWVIAVYFYLLRPALLVAYKGWRLASRQGLSHTEEEFTESFFGFLHGPLRVLGYCLSLNYLYDVATTVARLAELDPGYLSHLREKVNVDQTIYLGWLGFTLYRLQYYYLDELCESVHGREVDPGVLDLLHRVMEILIGTVTGLSVLGAAGCSPASLGWLTGTVGLGFGFASQEVVQNFLGGMMVALMRPFSSGDRVSISNGLTESVMTGTIQHTGYYQTTMLSDDGSAIIYVPNQWFVQSDIQNHSRSGEYFKANPRRKLGYQ